MLEVDGNLEDRFSRDGTLKVTVADQKHCFHIYKLKKAFLMGRI